MYTSLKLLFFTFLCSLSLAQVQIVNVSGDELRFASMYSLNASQSLLFSISYDNNTFESKVLNAYLIPSNDDVVDSVNNGTLSSIYIQVSKDAFSNDTVVNTSNITWTSKQNLYPNGSGVVSCQNYTGYNIENGTVYVSVVYPVTSPSLLNLTVSLEVEIDLESDCNVDNFKSSTIIWILLGILVIVAIIIIIAAAVFGFTYWKKKKLAGSALYNDL